MNAKMKAMPPTRPKVNQLQRKFLQERLNNAHRAKEAPVLPMPPDVAKAKQARDVADKFLGRWYTQVQQHEKRHDTRVRKERDKVTKAILFGTPEEALEAVEAFEKLDVE